MTSQPEIKIDGRPIGAAHPPYIVAELSGNHNGDIERAFALIEAAKKVGWVEGYRLARPRGP